MSRFGSSRSTKWIRRTDLLMSIPKNGTIRRQEVTEEKGTPNNLINHAKNHENSFCFSDHLTLPSRLSVLHVTVNHNTIVCFILTLESQLINCCLLYCEIVLWLFNWASVCYYGLPNVEYYLRNTLHWNTFNVSSRSWQEGNLFFKTTLPLIFLLKL